MFGEVIFSYSRKQAIEDGALVDVSELAEEAGFTVPVAVTSAVFSIVEDVPEGSCQDLTGRLWDVLWMGMIAAKGNSGESAILYRLILQHGRRKKMTLKMIISGGDNGEPVITIMLPEES